MVLILKLLVGDKRRYRRRVGQLEPAPGGGACAPKRQRHGRRRRQTRRLEEPAEDARQRPLGRPHQLQAHHEGRVLHPGDGGARQESGLVGEEGGNGGNEVLYFPKRDSRAAPIGRPNGPCGAVLGLPLLPSFFSMGAFRVSPSSVRALRDVGSSRGGG